MDSDNSDKKAKLILVFMLGPIAIFLVIGFMVGFFSSGTIIADGEFDRVEYLSGGGLLSSSGPTTVVYFTNGTSCILNTHQPIKVPQGTYIQIVHGGPFMDTNYHIIPISSQK